MKTKRGNFTFMLLILPSLAGIMLFYFIPFAVSLYYAMIDNVANMNFVWFDNFAATLTNELFLQASGNTLFFMIVSIPIGIFLSLSIALCLKKMKRGRIIASIALLLPIVVPSGTIVYFWKIIFDTNGLMNKGLSMLGFEIANPGQGPFAMVIIILVFLWKNVAYNVVLFWSGLNWIPKVYYEQYALEGGSPIKQFKNITLVYLMPTTFVVILMSIVNSFKVFREIYLLYGAYPTTEIYMLQHYINNQFASLNMQKLSSAAYILFLVISVVLLILFYAQKKTTDTYQ